MAEHEAARVITTSPVNSWSEQPGFNTAGNIEKRMTSKSNRTFGHPLNQLFSSGLLYSYSLSSSQRVTSSILEKSSDTLKTGEKLYLLLVLALPEATAPIRR